MKKKYFSVKEKKLAKAESNRKYRESRKEELKAKKSEYYYKNKESISTKAKEKYLQNPETVKQRVKKWKEVNRGKHNARCMARHVLKMRSRLPCLSEDDLWMIEQAYDISILRSKMTGIKWHVDHIVPLKHKRVCGLHVPWNLQVIPASVNCSKRNHFE
jgi:hypothetical protein